MRNHVVYPVFSKNVATIFTIVSGLYFNQIWSVLLVILGFLKKSLLVATFLDKTAYATWFLM